MARREQRDVKPAFEPSRALAAFKKQQAALQLLLGRNYQEASADEQVWQNLAQSLVERTFGKNSSNLSKYHSACDAGVHNITYDIGDCQRQQNFLERLSKFDSVMRSIIAELELDLPETDVKGVYAPGDEYDLYRDLSDIFANAQQRVLFVDAYIGEQLFNLYVDKVTTARVDILTNRVGANVQIVATKYATSHSLSLRTSSDFHDRLIFVDDRGWVIGQSVKDAATKKPTYLIELGEPGLTALRDLHDQIFQAATVVV